MENPSPVLPWSQIVGSKSKKKPLAPVPDKNKTTEPNPNPSTSKGPPSNSLASASFPVTGSVIIIPSIGRDVSRSSNFMAPGSAPIAPAPSSDTPKKKKKPKLNKEARLKRREQKALQSIYGPKDSHIQMISADVLRKLKNEVPIQTSRTSSSIQKPKSNLVRPLQPSSIVYKNVNQGVWGLVPVAIPVPATDSGNSVSVEEDFPSLSGFGDTKTKSFTDDNETGWITEPEPEENDGPSRNVSISESIPSTPKFEEPSFSILNSTPAIKISKKKPSKNPILVSLQVLASASTPPIKNSKKKENLKKQSMNINRGGNILDSSGVTIIRRGKMREKPKRKKPTKLKLAIMKSRFIRAAARVNSVASAAAEIPKKEDAKANEESSTVGEIKEEVVADLEVEKSQLQVPDQPEPEALLQPKSEPVESIPCPDDNVFRKLFDDALNISKQNESTIILKKLSDSESDVKPVVVEIPPDIFDEIKTSMHSRKFRKYCDMFVTKELHGLVISIMSELYKYQDRLYHTDPIKYQSKKRFIHGIKDVIMYLKLNKVQLVIIAPDIEPNNAKGGLDEKLTDIISLAKEQNVPYVFSGHRYILGKPMRIKNPVSVIGILNKQGTEESVKKLLEEATKLRESYESTFYSNATSKMLEKEKESQTLVTNGLENEFCRKYK